MGCARDNIDDCYRNPILLHSIYLQQLQHPIPGFQFKFGHKAAMKALHVDLIPYWHDGSEFVWQSLQNFGIGMFQDAVATGWVRVEERMGTNDAIGNHCLIENVGKLVQQIELAFPGGRNLTASLTIGKSGVASRGKRAKKAINHLS